MMKTVNMPGAPSDEDLAKTAMNEEVGKTSKTYMWTSDLRSPTAETDYPLVATPHDPYDNVAAMKMQVGNMAPANNWVVPFTEQDAAYNERKRIMDEQAKFDAWVTQKYDLTDPAQNNMLQQIAPTLFSRREEVINNLQALVSRYASIRLRGAKSEDDLRFQWLIDTGRIKMPQGPIWDPRAWRIADATGEVDDAGNMIMNMRARDEHMNERKYKEGFFSFAKWIYPGTMGKEADPANYFNIAGTINPFIPVSLPMRQTAADSAVIANYPSYANAAGNPRWY